jgi:hypothetical protein
MHDGVYNGMVNVGIDEKFDNEIMYDKFGELKTDATKKYGCC